LNFQVVKALFVKKRLIAAFIIILGACLLRLFVLQSYKSTTHCMDDTLVVGDFFLVNKFVYGRNIPFTDKRFLKIREPRRGDVIVFAYPEDPGKDFVMRVVGIPGDEVEGIDKRIYVNGKPHVNPHESHREMDVIPREQNPRDNFGPVKVPANSLFVMGDDRDRSYDSRFWGCVPGDRVKGLAFIRYWSWDPEHRRVRWGSIGNSIN
jgi:signal peptidase I